MKRLFVCMFLLSATYVSAQGGSQEITLQSKSLHENRRVWISLPPNYHLKKDSCHLMILLDGNNKTLFDLTVSCKRFLETNAVDLGDLNAPLSIVIGIEQKERGVDFVDSADQFFDFLSKEVIPYLQERYRILPYTILVGHSLAGRFALQSFLKHPETFNAIITASPALSGKASLRITKQLDSVFAHHSYKDRAWFLGSSSKPDDNTESQFRPFAIEMSKHVSAKSYSHFRFQFDTLLSLGHAKTPYLTIAEGLHFIYDPGMWQMPSTVRDKVFAGKISVAEATAINNRQVLENFGVTYKDNRWDLPEAYMLIAARQQDKAITFLQQSIARDPCEIEKHVMLIGLLKERKDKRLDQAIGYMNTVMNKMGLTDQEKIKWRARFKN